MALQESLKKLGEKLEDVLKNFSTLKVTTFTLDLAAKETKRAETTVNLDGDTKLAIPITDGAAIDRELLAIHNDAVKSAIEARVKTIAAAVDVVQAIIKLVP